jgi:hypothetical protein
VNILALAAAGEIGKGVKILATNDEDSPEPGNVSIINGDTYTKVRDIKVGPKPFRLARSPTNMIYVLNQGYDIPGTTGTVSVLNGATDNVTAGVIFNVNPANSGRIICNNTFYPPNTYFYIDNGTNCITQPTKGFEFNNWAESPLTNRNSSIPLESNSSGNLTINQYGTYTVNFKPLPPPIPPEYWTLIITLILTSVIGWSIPSIFGWVKAKAQRKHLEECIDQIGKLDKNTIEDKIKEYYVHGKISEEHRQFLKDRISEYYEEEKGSEGNGAPST